MKELHSKTALSFKLWNLRLAEFALIEQRIRDYLTKGDVAYDKLAEDEKLATLIGAQLAIENAISNGVLENDSQADNDLSDQFEAFLKMIVPAFDYYETLTWIENNTHDELSGKIERRFIDEGKYPKHEAYLRVLSMAISSFILSPEAENNRRDKVWEALYCCYLHAKRNYFQGSRE